MAVLPEGIHPAEIVSTLIFAWTTLIFVMAVKQRMKEVEGIEDKHYGFWLMALIL
ncbi:MAG: hypothetical protein QMC85_05140 [Methanocellales archaeon]|nr:hypothetical protein [Methanocellales archaeon]MDI6859863.1 hypothetical protein [Methanocellales archaeon]